MNRFFILIGFGCLVCLIQCLSSVPQTDASRQAAILRGEGVPGYNDPNAALHREQGMSLLERFAPACHQLMKTHYASEKKIRYQGHLWNLESLNDPFIFIANCRDDRERVISLPTVIHETTHSIIDDLGIEMAIKAGLDFKHGKTYYAFYLDEGDIHFMPLTAAFPAREMAESIPLEIRSLQCYDYYVLSVKAGDDQTTQQEGVYGLLNEFCAFYWTARTEQELIAFYRQLEPLFVKDVNSVFNNADRSYHYYLAIKYFILHYILFAQEHDPGVHDLIMGNRAFRSSFTLIDRTYARLCAEFNDEVLAFALELPARGIAMEQTGPLSFIGREKGGPVLLLELRNDYWKHELFEWELSKPAYVNLAAELAVF
ncbi:MAG: hypothetical protein JW881_16520 [Spirochaetales bacterium]|nr:hypothetical protein [Spirochaetales bacterium]